MIVGSPSSNEKKLFEILNISSFAIPNSIEKIKWDLSNTGWKVKNHLLFSLNDEFKVGLESDIALLLGKYLEYFCKNLIENENFLENSLWAIHPGKIFNNDNINIFYL